MNYVVVIRDEDGWHAIWTGWGWPHAVIAHAACVTTLRAVGHPFAEDAKIIPGDADYTHAPLSAPVVEFGQPASR